MAATIAPIRAINYAAEFVQQLPVTRENIRLRIMDDAAKLIWMAAPFRWTVGALTPTSIVNDVDEVTISGSIPADFLKILWAGLMSPTEVQDLVVVPNLPDGGNFKGQPKRVTFVSGSIIRLFPTPTAYNPVPLFVATYKKKHTEITAANEDDADTLVMDDEWYFVYEAWVLYWAFVYAEDPRAPAQFQLATFLLAMMKEIENPGINFYGEEVKG